MGFGKSQKMQRNLKVKKDAFKMCKDALIEAIQNTDPNGGYIVEHKNYMVFMTGSDIKKYLNAKSV